jgi:RNA polymerase sigma-54 factor
VALETKLHLTLGQRLVMTPALQQAIALLQKNRADLIETIREEMEENPALDAEESGAILPREGAGQERPEGGEAPTEGDGEAPTEVSDFEAYFRSRLSDFEPSRAREDADTPPAYEEFLRAETTLADHLTWQLNVNASAPRLRELGAFIIGHLNEEGYLAVPFEEIAALAGVVNEEEHREFEEALRLVQSMDPAGVGARSLEECLLLQIEALGLKGTLVEALVREHLPEVEAQRWEDIAGALNVSKEEVLEAYDALRHLSPKPGLQFSSSRSVTVVPDAYVRKVKGEYEISLNDEGLPKLRVNPAYERMLAGKTEEDVQGFLREKMRRAEWLIRSIYQRQQTIQRVIESIVRRQRDFLEHGPAFLKPLTLRDTAEDVSLHPSTVSRVVQGKYIQTPRGLFDLRFFFHAPLSSNGGEAFSSVQVKEGGHSENRRGGRRRKSPERRPADRAARGARLPRRAPHRRQVPRPDGHVVLQPAPQEKPSFRPGPLHLPADSRQPVGSPRPSPPNRGVGTVQASTVVSWLIEMAATTPA